MGITWLFWLDRYAGPPLVSVGSELILHSSMKTAVFLSLIFVGDDQDSEKSKPAGSDGERRGVKRQRDEKDEHGRAYYEFREEAYHSRWGKQSLSLKGVSAPILIYLMLTGESGKKGWIKNGIGSYRPKSLIESTLNASLALFSFAERSCLLEFYIHW